MQAVAPCRGGLSDRGRLPQQDCHDRSAFFRCRGVGEEVPDSGRLTFVKVGSRRVEAPLEAHLPGPCAACLGNPQGSSRRPGGVPLAVRCSMGSSSGEHERWFAGGC